MVTTAQVPVGTVSSLKGNVSVIPANGGPARPLQVGDVIHPGDRIISAAGAQIQVKDPEGKLWSPRDNAPLNTTAADDAAAAAKPDTGTAKAKTAATVVGGGDNLDDVIAAVNTGNEEDATAAGLAGGGGGGTLGEGLRVDRVTEVVSPQEFNYGTGDRTQAQDAPTATPLVDGNDAPVITDTPTDPDRPTTSFDPVTGNYRVTTPEDTPVSGQVKATDADGDPLTYVLGGTSPAHGTVVVNADGTWTYTPNKDYNGSDVFTVIVSDGRGGTATSTVNIGITPVNDPPVFTDPDVPNQNFDPTTDTYKISTSEDTTVVGKVAATDVDGDTLTFSLGATKPTHGTVEIAADGSYTYKPDKDYSGSDSFTVVVDDGNGGKVTSTVTVNIAPVADIPLVTVSLGKASPDVVTINKDNATTTDHGFKVTAINFDGSTGTVSTVSGGNVSGFGVAGSVSDDTGNDGQPSELGYDSATKQSEKLSIAFDHPASSATVQFSWLSPSEHATYTLYDANGNVIGSGVVTGVTDQIDPAITLKADNGASISRIDFGAAGARDDYVIHNVTYVRSESIPITVTATPTDSDYSEHVSALVISVPSDATLSAGTKNPDGTWTLPLASNGDYQVVIDPITHAVKVTGLVMTLPSDHVGDVKVTVTATVYDTVTTETAQGSGSAENHVPVLTDPDVPGQSFDPVTGNYKVTTDEDVPVSGQVKATDADGDTLTYTLGSIRPANGTVVVNADGTWTYTPNKDYNGSDVFTVLVEDGHGGKATSTVTIGITPVNDPPKPEDPDNPNFDPATGTYSVTTPEDTPVKGQVKATDADGDTLTFTLGGTTPAHGTVVVNADGTWTYTPNKDYNGSDVFTVLVDDGHGGKATSTVKIGVTPVNDAPVAANDSSITPEDRAVVIDVRANDKDVDGDTLTVTQINGQPISATQSVTLAGQGVVSLNADGTLTFTPAPDYNGQVKFAYTVQDPAGATATADVTVDVTPLSDTPVAVNDTATTPEDTPVKIDVLANDTDADGDALSITAINGQPISLTQPVTLAGQGVVSLNADGTLTFNPAANYHGKVEFTYTVTDGQTPVNGNVTVEVTSVNDAPVAADDRVTTPEDQPIEIDVRANDRDADGDTLTVTAVTQPGHGTVTINPATGNPVYTPAPDYNGTDTFTYTVRDPSGATSQATVTVTVGAVNDAPQAQADVGATDQNGTLTVSAADGVIQSGDQPAGRDSDPDGDTLAVSAVSHGSTAGQVGQPLAGAFGTLTLHADGSYTYVPNDAAKALGQGATGQDVFSYTVKDAGGLTSSTTLTLTVTGTNDAPVAVADRATTPEDTPVVIRVLDNDSDVDGDKLTITQIAGQNVASGGEVAIKDSAGTQIATVKLNADGTLTLTPANDYNGPVNFNYTVTDGKGGTDTASVSVVVDDVNDAPIADPDVVSGLEDTPFTFDPRANDTDPDGDPLTITQINGQPISTTQAVSLPQGTLKLNADGTLTFSPAPNYNGKLSFDYTVSDGKGGTDTATVNMTVKAVNDPPVITDTPTDPNLPGGGNGFDPKTGNYNVTTPEDTPVKGQVKATDVDGDPLTYALGSTTPTHGTVVVNADGTWTYTPNKDYNGSDSFTVLVSDGNGGTATSTVTIGITPVNDPPKPEDPDNPNFDPVTGTYSVTTPEDTPVKGQIKATDVDGDTLTFTLGGTSPAHGTVVVNADGTWTYTPGKDYNGNDVFTVTISDGHGGTATSTVKIGVTPVNDNPTANPDQVTVAEDSVVTFDPRSNDSDVDGDSLNITAVNGQPISTTTPVVLPEGTISLNGNGTLTFTPAPNYNGTLSLTYTISDGHGGTANAPITIDVTPVDNVAVVGSGSVSLSEEGLAGGIADSTGSPDTTNATSASGKLTVTDIDGGSNTLTLSGPSGLTSGGAAITWSGNGTVDNPLVGSAGGKTIITASIDSNGNYQVSLQGAVDHANPNAEDVRSIQLSVQASNGVATSTGTLTLNIEDDSPASGNQTQYVSPATQSTNVMLIVDVSGSMENALADKTVNGLKATIKGLLDHYGELGDVRVQIVTFSDSASARATWMTLADAKTFVDKLSANGGTNYDAALASAQSGFNASGKLAGAVNVSYFFSDGEPTKNKEVDNGSDKTKWESFLKANDIDSYAMGINGASSSNLKYLEPIAYNGASETERPAVILTSNTAVKTYLDNSVVTVEHGSLASLAGADGLKAVTAFSAANQTSSTYDAATGIQTITLSSGSRIELNLTTGEYTYTRPAGNTGDSFSYTIVDKDGDKGSGTLTLTTVNHAPDGTDGTVTLAEDTSYHLQVSDFGFRDSDAGDRLSAVRIDTLPTDGTLTLNGKAVVAGQVIAAADIGSLVFKPDANENGATYAKMTFSVADRAGSYDTTPNTLTFNVTPVNDAPLARIASHGGLLGLVDVSVDPILNFSSHQHLGVYDVDNNLTRIDVSVKNLLSVGGLANGILGLIGLGGDHSKLTIDTALAQSYGFTISGNDTRHIVITSATAGGTVDYGLVNKLLATLTYDPAELLGISADLLPKMTIKATDAFGLSSTDTASAGLISVHVDTVQHVLDTKVDVSVSAAVDSAVTLTHDALSGEFTHAIDVGLSVSTPLTLTGHSTSSDVFAWSLSDHGTASASTGTNGTTASVTHAVDTIVDFDTAARSAGGDVLDLRDLLSGEHTVGGTGNLSQFLDFDTTSQPGSTIVHVSTQGGFTAGYDAKAEDQTIVLKDVNLRGDLGLHASASDNQVIAELMTRGKLLVDNH